MIVVHFSYFRIYQSFLCGVNILFYSLPAIYGSHICSISLPSFVMVGISHCCSSSRCVVVSHCCCKLYVCDQVLVLSLPTYSVNGENGPHTWWNRCSSPSHSHSAMCGYFFIAGWIFCMKYYGNNWSFWVILYFFSEHFTFAFERKLGCGLSFHHHQKTDSLWSWISGFMWFSILDSCWY